MKKLTVTIDLRNDAFAPTYTDHDGQREAARILRELATLIEQEGLQGLSVPVRDINGNTIGRAEVK